MSHFIRVTTLQTLAQDVVAETGCTTEQAKESIQWLSDVHRSVRIFGDTPYCTPRLRNFNLRLIQPLHHTAYGLLFFSVYGEAESAYALDILQHLVRAKAVNMTTKTHGVIFELDWAGMPDSTRALLVDVLKEDILK